MELFKLDSSYLPSTTIRKFDTLVWTERYDPAGEFKLTMMDDITGLSLLPFGTLISHTDTREVMIVENHYIKRDNKKKLIVEISGRTFETFAEQRPTSPSDHSLKESGSNYVEVLSARTSAEAAEYILRAKLEPGTATSNDAIPNLLVVNETSPTDADVTYQIKRGDVYSQMLSWLKIDHTGIKCRRPQGAQTTLDLVLHNGVDRTTTVIFQAGLSDLEDAEYFKSVKNYRNYARVSGVNATRLHRTTALGSDTTGLNRRIIYVETNDYEGTDTSSTGPLAGLGQETMDDKHRILGLVQAKISETAKPKFKFNYDVGDIVMVFGEFDIAQAMRVTEHILTVDSKGIRGYPALSSITSE